MAKNKQNKGITLFGLTGLLSFLFCWPVFIFWAVIAMIRAVVKATVSLTVGFFKFIGLCIKGLVNLIKK